MIDQNLLDQSRDSLARMKSPVRLILFTRDIGCETCPEALKIVRAVKNLSPKIALEIYDQVMDRDKAALYKVKYAPAIVVQGINGRFSTFYGLLEDVFLKILLDTILAIAEDKSWFPEKIRRTLDHLEKDVNVQVFVETDCVQCKPVAETGIGLAFMNNLVSTEVIITSGFPDLVKKYSIKKLPKTVFGMNLHLDGHVTESEFLEMIFEAEGIQAGPDRRCLSCGKPSPDIICTSCKTKIQAEAIDHKTRGEKIRQM